MTIENQRNFEYFYGIESEEFNFYQVPKVLLQDPYYKELKDSTKLLYSVFLNRMSLSRKNNWVDEENKVYIIYSIKEICEDMGCCKETAIDRTKELEKFGLIEIIKKGQGNCNLIYVKDFLHVTNVPLNNDEYTEVGKSDFKKSGKQNSRSQESRIHKVGESDTINNNINNTKAIKTDLSENDITTTTKNEGTKDVVVDDTIRLLFNPLKERLSDKEILTVYTAAKGNEELIKGAVNKVINYRSDIESLVGLMLDYIKKGGYPTISYQPNKKKQVNNVKSRDPNECWSFINWEVPHEKDSKEEYTLAAEKYQGKPFPDEIRNDFKKVCYEFKAQFKELEDKGYFYDGRYWTCPDGKIIKVEHMTELI